ncbi:MAG: EamA family transporter [Anaerolineales bacterium]
MKAWILPATVTFFAWGLWGLLPKITTRYISPASAIVFEAIGGLPIALIVLISLRFRLEWAPRGISLAMITGALGVIGALGFLVAVQRGPVSLVVTMTALYPALTVLIAVVALGEQVSTRQAIGVLLALAAMLLVAT